MEANPYYLKDTEDNYYNKYPEFQIWEDGKKAGIREVVKSLAMLERFLILVNLCQNKKR